MLKQMAGSQFLVSLATASQNPQTFRLSSDKTEGWETRGSREGEKIERRPHYAGFQQEFSLEVY